VSNGILLPVAISRAEPDLKKCESQPGSGNPIIEAVIGSDGRVVRARAVSPSTAHACVVEAALAAVKLWKFCPAEREGHPMEMTMQFTVLVHYR
jgi:TonB family protein